MSDEFPFNQCVEAMNVDFRNGGLGRRRGGSKDVLGNTTGDAFTAGIITLARHTPGEETAGEVWAWEDAIPGNISYLPPGTAWSTVATNPAYNTNADIAATYGVSYNGKFFLFYRDATAEDRLKVFRPGINKIGFVGLKPGTNAPTVANTGVGAYAAVLRYYRVRWLELSGTTVVRKSEATPSVSFTPSGAGAAARVTRPTAIGEDETHWMVEFSPDNVNWYVAGTIAIGTTTYDDNVLVANEPNGELSELVGTYTLVPSAKVGCTDGNRLVIGNLDVAGHESRVMWLTTLGSLSRGDDERIFQTSTVRAYLDLDPKRGGGLTGMEIIDGTIYVFKFRQVWELSPTGDIFRPYRARRLSGTVGSVGPQPIAMGEDAHGNPCIYFMSHKGPYRVSRAGLEYLGRDIEDLTRTSSGKPNINTAANRVIAHSVFHGDLGQWWVWFSTGTANTPTEGCIFDVKRGTRRDAYGVRGGWSRLSGDPATATCSCLGPYDFGSTGNLRPWIGIPGTAKMLILDRDDVQNDNGTTFQAYVKTRSVASFGRKLKIGEPVLVASHHTAGGVTLRTAVDRDFGFKVTTADVTITGADIDKTLVKKVDGGMGADAAVVQIQVGDSAAASTAWELKMLKVPVMIEGDI